jgi:hypothetical protein
MSNRISERNSVFKALRQADKIASRAHDYLWAMNIEQSGASGFGKDDLLRRRDHVSDEIHKLHAALRPLIEQLGNQPEQGCGCGVDHSQEAPDA